MDLCERCMSAEATVQVSGEQEVKMLCGDCFNELVSAEIGIELEEQPPSISVPDFQGVTRNFTIEKRILPNGIFLEAKEDIMYGYTVAVHGEVDCDQHMLFKSLLEKVRHYLSKQYLKEETFPNSVKKFMTMTGDDIVGMIDYDENNEDVPLIIVDGQPYEWDEFGKILTSNQGFQFQLKIVDLTDDVE